MTTPRRYEPILKIASGGTAAVYVGSAVGALGFRQLVAIKRPHAHLADDPSFRAALVEEAKIASRLRHANVVDVRDVEVDETGIQLVMDYVEGASLSELIRSWSKDPPRRPEAVALRIVLDACEGLRAVHELRGDDGQDLGLVHRDVSPANVLVGLDGVARIADFGLAKPLLAVERTTSEGALRGKLGYMAPEYIRGKGIDRRIDVFAMGVVLWESLARRRLFRGENDGETLDRVQQMSAPSLSTIATKLGAAVADLDAVIERALAKDPEARLPSMDALVAELERVIRTHDLAASHGEVRDAFGASLKADLEDRRVRVQAAVSASALSASLASASGVPAAAPLASEPPPPSASLPALPSHTPPALSASQALAPITARTPRPSQAVPRSALVAVLAVTLLAVITAVGVAAARLRASAAQGARATAAAASSEAAASPHPSALPDDPSASASASASAPTSRRPGIRPPRPGPASDEPGKKPPRPNPYASAAAPR